MNLRFGKPPEPNRAYTPRRGVYAVITTGQGILATQQMQPRVELQLPGGGIDPGEAPLPALHREVYEETGYRIRNPRRLGMFHRFTYMPEYEIWAQKLCTVYLARIGPRISAPTEPGHHAVMLSWQAAEEQLGVEGDRHFLRLVRRRLRV